MRKHAPRATAAAVLAAAVVAAIGAPSASAAAPPPLGGTASQGTTAPLSPQKAKDAATVAKLSPAELAAFKKTFTGEKRWNHPGPKQNAGVKTANDLDLALRKTHAATYLGQKVTETGLQLYVRKGASLGVPAAVDGLPVATVQVNTPTDPQASLSSWNKLAKTNGKGLTALGVTGFGVDPATGKVKVDVADLSPAATAKVQALNPAFPVVFDKADGSAVFKDAVGTGDTIYRSPYEPGTGGVLCHTAFNMLSLSGGSQYALSAGHCHLDGSLSDGSIWGRGPDSTWASGDTSAAWSSSDDVLWGQWWGWNKFGSGLDARTLDASIIQYTNGSGPATIQTGGGTSRTVTDWVQDIPIGFTGLCASDSLSAEECGITVDDPNYTALVGTTTLYGTLHTHTSSAWAQSGKSGTGMYLPGLVGTDPAAAAVGVLSAGNGDGTEAFWIHVSTELSWANQYRLAVLNPGSLLPKQPVAAVAMTDNNAHVTWNVDHGAFYNTSFNIEYKKSQDADVPASWTSNTMITGDPYQGYAADIQGLQPNTSYDFRVAAISTAGGGPWSNLVSGYSQNVAVVADDFNRADTNLTLTGLGTSSVGAKTWVETAAAWHWGIQGNTALGLDYASDQMGYVDAGLPLTGSYRNYSVEATYKGNSGNASTALIGRSWNSRDYGYFLKTTGGASSKWQFTRRYGSVFSGGCTGTTNVANGDKVKLLMVGNSESAYVNGVYLCSMVDGATDLGGSSRAGFWTGTGTFPDLPRWEDFAVRAAVAGTPLWFTGAAVTAVNTGGGLSVNYPGADPNGSPNATYTIQTAPTGSGTWTTVATAASSATKPIAVTGVAPGTYDVRVSSTNGVGQGTWLTSTTPVTVYAKGTSDNFNRANTSSGLGNTSGDNRTWVGGAWQVSGNQARGLLNTASGTNDFALVSTDTGTGSVKATLASAVSNPATINTGLIGRYSSGSSYWEAQYGSANAGAWTLWKVNGSALQMGHGTVPAAAGDVVELFFSATQVVMKVNGVAVVTLNDTFNSTSTLAGFKAFHNATVVNNPIWDDFSVTP